MSTISGMAIAGGNAYIAVGYDEGYSSQNRLSIADMGSKVAILGKGARFTRVATDGVRVYWAGDDPNVQNDGFVMATAVSDDSKISFGAAHAYPMKNGDGKTGVIQIYDAIDLFQGCPDEASCLDQAPSGIAVQQSGNFLFVTHAGANTLNVLNKLTGELVATHDDYESPGNLAVDSANNLWMIHGPTGARVVQSFSVGADGTLTPGTSIGGMIDPLALAATSMILVADGGTSQQVKAFNLSGAPLWTLGNAGGYSNGPTVTDATFDFLPGQRYTGFPFIAFQPDGSFWLGDTGCYRALHFSAARSVVDRLSYVPTFYNAGVDPNAPTRVFAEYLEYQVDYNLPLGPRNGSWTLARNWRAKVPAGYDNEYARLKYVTTLSNGRTYAVVAPPVLDTGRCSSWQRPVCAIRGLPCLAARYFRVALFETRPSHRTSRLGLNHLSSVSTRTAIRSGARRPCSPRLMSRHPTRQDPYPYDPNVWRIGNVTAGGVLISFDPEAYQPDNPFHRGWHLGGVKIGGSQWLWEASRSTPTNYTGPWPTDGTFDIMNGVGNAGGAAMTTGHHVFYAYRGENWQAAEVNKYRHYFDDGLFIGEFEVTDADGNGIEAAPGMAGNAYSSWLVTLPDGRVFIYHNDEGYHAGVHRWRVDGLDTVAEQQIPITLYKDLEPGLTGEYFATSDWNRFNQTATRLDPAVSFQWAGTPAGVGLSDAGAYSVRWTGYLIPSSSDSYTFQIDSADWTRMWVDGQLVIPGGSGTQSGSAPLHCQPDNITQSGSNTGTMVRPRGIPSNGRALQFRHRPCRAPRSGPSPVASI